MTRTTLGKPLATLSDLDALLQDSFLLVVQLRHAAAAQLTPNLWDLCVQHVEHARQALTQWGLAQRTLERIILAQCALLDETVLECAAQTQRAAWASQTLQARFFNRHQAGAFLYEDLREALREPAPDPLVLGTYQRVLELGFRGRYRNADDPERMALIATLAERVAPMGVGVPLATAPAGPRRRYWPRLSASTLAQVLYAGALLAGAWWALDALLRHWIATHLSSSI